MRLLILLSLVSLIQESSHEEAVKAGRAFEAEKKWADALKSYQKAETLPRSPSCIVPDTTWHHLRLDQARCLHELGRVGEAKELFDELILRGDVHLRLTGDAVIRRVGIAIAEKATTDFDRRLEWSANDRPKEPAPGQVREYLRLLERRAAGDIEGLWKILLAQSFNELHNNRFDWEAFRSGPGWMGAEAADCLADLGDPAVDFLERRARFGYGLGPLVALARTTTPKARRLVGDLSWVEGWKNEETPRGLARVSASPLRTRALPPRPADPPPQPLDREAIARALGGRLTAAVPDLVDLLARGTDHSRSHALVEAAHRWKHGILASDDLEPLWSMAVKEAWTLDWPNLIGFALHAEMEVLGRVLGPALRLPDRDLRNRAVEAVAKLGHPSSFQDMAALLDERDGGNRGHVMNALARPEAAEYADRIAVFLADREPSWRSGAAFTLSGMKAVAKIPAIEALLKDPMPWVRKSAVEALDRLGARQSGDRIRPLAEDESAEVRGVAVAFLERLTSIDLAPLEVSRLSNPDPKVRSGAARRLGLLHALAHSGAVAKLVDDPNSEVRSDACMSLGLMGARDQMAALRRGLKDPVSRAMACWAAGRLAHVDLADEIVPFLTDSEEFNRIKAAGALSRMGLHADKIAAQLKDSSEWVRGSAALWLARLGAREHLDAIVRLAREDEEARDDALEALVLLEARDQVPMIAGLFRGEKDSSIAVILGRLGARDHAEKIRPILLSRGRYERCEAILGLAMMEDTASVPELERLERVRDHDVKWAASCALVRLGRKSPAAERDLLRSAIESGRYSSNVMKALTRRHGASTWEKLGRTVETTEAVLDEAGLRKVLEKVGLKLHPLKDIRLWSRIPPGLKVSAWGVADRMLDHESALVLPEGESFHLATPKEAEAWWLEKLK